MAISMHDFPGKSDAAGKAKQKKIREACKVAEAVIRATAVEGKFARRQRDLALRYLERVSVFGTRAVQFSGKAVTGY